MTIAWRNVKAPNCGDDDVEAAAPSSGDFNCGPASGSRNCVETV
jgi:hypothetical protein